MRNRTLKSMLLLTLPLVAALAIPGEAASVGGSNMTVIADTAPLPQAQFGMLLDPHVAPVLHFAPPATLWEL
jgi:hypothetical protein